MSFAAGSREPSCQIGQVTILAGRFFGKGTVTKGKKLDNLGGSPGEAGGSFVLGEAGGAFTKVARGEYKVIELAANAYQN